TYILSGNSVMNIVGDIQSENTDLNDLIPREEEVEANAETGKKQPYQFHFPTMFNLNVDVNVGHLTWNKFKATDVSGNVLMLKDRLDIRDLRTTTAGGLCNGQLSMADMGNNRFKITSNSHYEKVNMDEVMRVFNEFGQKMITSENIKGELTADMDMAAEMDGSLTIDPKKLLAQVNVHITGGELAHVKTFKNISTYMRKDPKARLVLKKHAEAFEKRLEVIRFSDLENTIEIKDEKVTIPRMIVKSTALDLKISGTHTFANQVDYHFSFRFLDLKEKVEENEFGIIKDDGTGLKVYLRMFGDVNDPTYEIDRDQMKEEFKVKLADEKQTVKSLLKEEFGFFKNDTTLKANTKQQQDDVEFILEWDNAADKNKDNTNSTSEEKKDKGKKKLDKLKKKMGIEEKKNEVEIEIDENP
ncbi:MAG: AsmA-like C-terminal region-containing protein, partial [Flavobacteriales bacterium]